MQHGMFSNSEIFMLNGTNSTAFKIAKAGYDVWLGNNRGNQFSKTHVRLDPANSDDQAEYFDFCFEEMG